MRTFQWLTAVALVIGLALAFHGFYTGAADLLGWDDDAVLTLYLLLQYSPLLVTAASGLIFFSSKRAVDSRTTRRAQLRRRGLFDFVSPAAVGTAVLVYLAYVVFILWIRRFDYSWFGGYWNIVGITAMNLVFLAVGFRAIYGKKPDPYQAEPDRMRSIEVTLKILLFTSVVGTLKIILAISLQALELGELRPIATSLYFQLVALVSLAAFRIDGVDFEVYRDEPRPSPSPAV